MGAKPRSFAMLVVASILASTGALAADPPAPELTPLVGEVLWAPRTAFGSDGDRHLVYEVRLGNPTPGTLSLSKVDVLDAATGRSLLSMDDVAVGGRFSIGGRRGAEAKALSVGQFGVLFVHVPLKVSTAVPKAIVHRVAGVLSLQDKPEVRFELTTAPSRVIDENPVLLGPPLAGAGYLAGDGCCDTIRHVRALLPLDGSFALAQRFAIDWEQVGTDRRVTHAADLKKVESYNIFGKNVLAVADGTVIDMRNDLPEQIPGALPTNLPIDQADGNFVVLDIGKGAFALFAHMQPGSVKVAKGTRVKAGDVLGKVGNTGNTSAPHLHFHVMDGPSPLLSNGIPYLINGFTLVAIDKAGTADFDKAEAEGLPLTLTPLAPPQQMWNMLPMDLTVVDFSK
jgi:hypothetical protein